MLYNNRYCFVIRTSKNAFYKFIINNHKNLFLQSYDYNKAISSSILKENIISFSATIDSLDKIHILYRSINGKIKYIVYPSGVHKDITILNTNNNEFNILFLTMKIVKSKPHIFYILQNRLHASHCILYHAFWDNNNFYNNRIENISFSRYTCPYVVDTCNNDIYLFYSRNQNNNFAIKKFDADSQSWSNYDDNIFLPSANNANFLINDKNIILLCYNGSLNKNIQTFIKYKVLNCPNSQWSSTMVLSDENINSIHVNIINKSENTYVLWEENGQVVYRKSSCGRNDWSPKKVLTYKKQSFFTGIYLSNHQSDKDYKSIFTTFDLGTFPYPIINLENTHSRESYIENTLFNNPQTFSANKTVLTFNKTEKKYIKRLESIIADKDKKIMELSQSNLILKNELDQKTNQLRELDEKLKKNWLWKFLKLNS